MAIWGGMVPVNEATTYLKLLNEGAVAELQWMILRLGRKRFGPASSATEAALKKINDLTRLELLTEHLGEVNPWAELLAHP
jgi:hypothetical protein